MRKKELLISIEKLRKEMNDLVIKRGFLHKKILNKSQELDKLLNKYNKENFKISNK